MSENIYTYIETNFNIKVSDYQFKRDYIKEPLRKWVDKPYKEDVEYLFITLNLSRKEVSGIFGYSDAHLKKIIKKYNIVKSYFLQSENRKRTNKKIYGVEYYSQYEDYNKKTQNTKNIRYGNSNYNNREKAKQTCVEKYGVEYPMQTEEIKNRFKESCFNIYGVEYPMQTEEIKNRLKNTLIEKYGVDNSMKLESTVEKIWKTKIKNGTSSSSNDEEIIYEKLKEVFNDIKRQYKSKNYPFNCDFYIPNLDLYIEYNGFWTHDNEPFVESKEQLEKIKLWESKGTEQYRKAIDTWTKRDVLKRKIAKQNKLNYLEFFNMDEFNQWFENFVKDINVPRKK